jgi:hypothetical protein
LELKKTIVFWWNQCGKIQTGSTIKNEKFDILKLTPSSQKIEKTLYTCKMKARKGGFS